jgi:WD40 repeat protein
VDGDEEGFAMADTQSQQQPTRGYDADEADVNTQQRTTKAPRMRLLAQSLANVVDRDASSALPAGAIRPRPFLTSAQWTADGASIIATSSDQTVSTIVLPQDLLDAAAAPQQLTPDAATTLPEPTQTIVSAPYFSLADPTTQIFLAACRDHPIQLYHAFPNGGQCAPLTSYRLIRKETEAYIAPSSMIWEAPGTHFVCGSANRIDYFDTSGRASDGPLLTIPTIPSRRHIMKGGGVGMKGTVSALAASPADANGGSLIAAGTWTRWVGMYDLHRTDKTVANWRVSKAVSADDHVGSLGGQGVAQVAWSPCGRYLIINERHSDGFLVYDIRVTGQLLSVLRGRKASTQQRLSCDVFQSDTYANGGFELWGGSQDGVVNVWEEVGLHNDLAVAPSWSWEAHESPAGTTMLHSSGSVVATASGGWEHSKAYDTDAGLLSTHADTPSTVVMDESSLRLWSIGTPDEVSRDD